MMKIREYWDAILAFSCGFALTIAAAGGYYYYSNLTRSVTMEAGAAQPDAAEYFVKKGKSADYVTNLSEAEMRTPGIYELTITSGNKDYEVQVEVVDTTAPAVVTQDVELHLGESADPMDFVQEITDVQEVAVGFAAEPDFAQTGEQEVMLTLIDASGNEATAAAKLNILTDTEAPVISGVEDQKVYVGDTITYKTGVTWTDNWDDSEDLQLEIDNSQVDNTTPGEYSVIYRVTDLSGNTAEATATITVVDPVQEKFEQEEAAARKQVEALAKETVASYRKEGQTTRELLEELFWFVKNKMTYTGTSDKTREASEALRGFTEGQGDCFTYFAMLKSLMTEMNLETIDLQRVGGKTGHYWSLVKVDGQWYHIDACARGAAKFPEWICFLKTDEEVKEFSTDKVPGYYTYDQSLYPTD